MSKLYKKANSAIALFYGTIAIISFVALIGATCYWIYMVIVGEKQFSWGTLFALLLMTALVGVIGFTIYGAGQKDAEK